MQVSQIQDHCTHAVIGGKQSIEFGISNSAEFFNILSSTLYKDQILAVVREVLCNAWDAHIEAGCTDRPVEITLTSDSFVIKDFGNGIHADDMGPIYGTYGNSTKKNDGKQTGGFGLGCKAPFAYTDHFEVASCHDGIKTIYSLSKSSAQVMGKPGIIPIASFPTTESGLTVTIRTRPNDTTRFKELIKQIIYNGDMHMMLNGEVTPILGFNSDLGNYLITSNKPMQNAPRICVRYGNVIYPVDLSAQIAGGYTKVASHLDLLRSRGYTPNIIIFQAPPHSISVTPSRESLSMQEHTINTLNGLFDGFLSMLDTEFKQECIEQAKVITEEAVATCDTELLLRRENKLPIKTKETTHVDIDSLSLMAAKYLEHNYPAGLEYRKADITHRVLSMVKANLIDKGKAYSFLRALKFVKTEHNLYAGWGYRGERSSWLQKRVLAPLLTKLYQAGLNTKKLYVCDDTDLNWTNSATDAVPPLVLATDSKPEHLLATLPYLRNIVVITSRRKDLVNRISKHEVFKAACTLQGFIVYSVGLKKGEAEAARQFFNKQKMTVVDLTTATEVAKTTPRNITPRKPVKQGLACLSSAIYGDTLHIPQVRSDTASRIEEPEFVVQIPNKYSTPNSYFDPFNQTTSIGIVKLFGDKGGVTTSQANHEKWIAKGCKPVTEYVLEKVCAYLMGNPRIEEYWGYNCQRFMYDTDDSELVKLIFSEPILMKEFELINNLTDLDKVYLGIWTELQRKTKVASDVKGAALLNWLTAIPLATNTKKVKDKLKTPMLGLLDTRHMSHLLKDPTQAPKALSILITVLNS